jgi:hypothetical protein
VEILNLGSAPEHKPKSRRKLRVILGIGALAAVTGIGSTLAANISLNGGGNVEFGQGVATTAACDENITLTPVSGFSNTEADASFAMTAIQVSGIDLTPEGWDVFGDDWVSGFHPGDNTNDFLGYWDENMKEHAGQYFNSETAQWTNTCANKSLMVRAYTDDVQYINRTTDNNISSPLLLSGFNARPINGYVAGDWYNSANSGVGFRFETGNIEGDYGSYYWAIEDCDYRCWNEPIHITKTWSGEYLWDNSTVIIHLNWDENYLPADSRWVNKLTIESAASTPNGWYSEN